MTTTSKALAACALAVLIGGCTMDRSTPAQTAASSPPQTTPSAMEPVMTQTAPVEGGTTPTAPAGANTIATAPAAPIPVTQVANPQQTLAGATVKDSSGAKIGEVKSVRVTSDGKVASVSVGVGARTVALQPARLKYVQAENTITTDQSRAEIERQR
jgi:hypothetical protein